MAGPVNGLGGGQQIPLSQPFQPGGSNRQVQEENNRDSFVSRLREQNQAPSETQATEADTENSIREQVAALAREPQTEDNGTDRPRGGIVDIRV